MCLLTCAGRLPSGSRLSSLHIMQFKHAGGTAACSGNHNTATGEGRRLKKVIQHAADTPERRNTTCRTNTNIRPSTTSRWRREPAPAHRRPPQHPHLRSQTIAMGHVTCWGGRRPGLIGYDVIESFRSVDLLGRRPPSGGQVNRPGQNC